MRCQAIYRASRRLLGRRKENRLKAVLVGTLGEPWIPRGDLMQLSYTSILVEEKAARHQF
jgi:hypothetical protein